MRDERSASAEDCTGRYGQLCLSSTYPGRLQPTHAHPQQKGAPFPKLPYVFGRIQGEESTVGQQGENGSLLSLSVHGLPTYKLSNQLQHTGGSKLRC